MSLSLVSILLFSSSLVTPCVLVPCWLAWSELSVKTGLSRKNTKPVQLSFLSRKLLIQRYEAGVMFFQLFSVETRRSKFVLLNFLQEKGESQHNQYVQLLPIFLFRLLWSRLQTMTCLQDFNFRSVNCQKGCINFAPRLRQA